MKKINLNIVMAGNLSSVYSDRKRFHIFIAWGVDNLFKNKKKALIFQASVNTWVNDTFFELNSIYTEILYNYRRSWTFTTSDVDGKMKDRFEDIEKYFNKLYMSDYKGAEGAFWAFDAIEQLCAQLQASIALLNAFHQEKRGWEFSKRLNMISTQINRILKEIKETTDPEALGKPIRRTDLY